MTGLCTFRVNDIYFYQVKKFQRKFIRVNIAINRQIEDGLK